MSILYFADVFRGMLYDAKMGDMQSVTLFGFLESGKEMDEFREGDGFL